MFPIGGVKVNSKTGAKIKADKNDSKSKKIAKSGKVVKKTKPENQQTRNKLVKKIKQENGQGAENKVFQKVKLENKQASENKTLKKVKPENGNVKNNKTLKNANAKNNKTLNNENAKNNKTLNNANAKNNKTLNKANAKNNKTLNNANKTTSLKRKLSESEDSNPQKTGKQNFKVKEEINLNSANKSELPPAKKLKALPINKNHSVTVSNVPINTPLNELKDIFSQYGNIIKFRQLKAPETGAKLLKNEFLQKRKSYGAYIVFDSEEEVNKALEANGTLFNEHHLQVNTAAGVKKHDQKKAIFVGNLPYHAEEEDVRQLFESCGDIHSVHIVRNESGQCVGLGFVNFEYADSVELALQLKDVTLYERTLRISRPRSQSHDNEGKNVRDRNSIYVTNLPTNVTQHDIKKLFSHCGRILSVVITITSRKTSAIVKFANATHVHLALTMKKPTIKGNKLKVFLHKSTSSEELSVYVKNLAASVTVATILKVFKKCGTILNIHILSKMYKGKKSCFINFASKEAVTKALEMENIVINGSRIVILKNKSKESNFDSTEGVNEEDDAEGAQEDDVESEEGDNVEEIGIQAEESDDNIEDVNNDSLENSEDDDDDDTNNDGDDDDSNEQDDDDNDQDDDDSNNGQDDDDDSDEN